MTSVDVAFFDIPYHSRIATTLGFVQALRARGLSVDSWSLAPYAELVAQSGARFQELPPFGPRPEGSLHVRVLQYALDQGEALTQAVARTRPRVVVYTSKCLWAAVVADRLGLPSVCVHTNYPIPRGYTASEEVQRLAWPERTRRRDTDWFVEDLRLFAALKERWALPRVLPQDLFQGLQNCINLVGDRNIAYAPASFAREDAPFDDSWTFTGPCFGPRPMDDDPEVEAWLEDGVVLVSLGSMPDYNAHLRFYTACVEALRRGGQRGLLSTGHGLSAEALEPLPANVWVRTYVPQLQVLARSGCFVTHGGTNSVWEALLAGVPMVVAPQGGDQHLAAERLEQLGAGIWCREDCPSPEALLEMIEAVTSDAQARAAVDRLGQELRDGGGSERAAEIVAERLQDAG